MRLRPRIATILMIVHGVAASREPAPTISLFELLHRSNDFDGQRIRVRATYRYGFEWQELYCLSSQTAGRVWLELLADLPGSVRAALRRMPKNQGTVNALFTGRFRGGRSAFGDGSYRFQLELERVDRLEVVSSSGAVPTALSPRERSKVCRCQIGDTRSSPAIHSPGFGAVIVRRINSESPNIPARIIDSALVQSPKGGRRTRFDERSRRTLATSEAMTPLR